MLYPFDSEKPRGDEPINMYMYMYKSGGESIQGTLNKSSFVLESCFNVSSKAVCNV